MTFRQGLTIKKIIQIFVKYCLTHSTIGCNIGYKQMRYQMTIALLHKHYTEKHLEEVATEMTTLGAPTIKAIWSDLYGMWLAVEGCHRIRAAKQLGFEPVIDDISNDETVTMEIDGEDTEVLVQDSLEELTDNAPKTEIISF